MDVIDSFGERATKKNISVQLKDESQSTNKQEQYKVNYAADGFEVVAALQYTGAELAMIELNIAESHSPPSGWLMATKRKEERCVCTWC